MSDEIRKAEKRGYSRGYDAGRRRKQRLVDTEKRLAKENAFWQRSFLALLPWAMSAQGWTFGDQPITSSDDRIELARRTADRATRVASNRCKL